MPLKRMAFAADAYAIRQRDAAASADALRFACLLRCLLSIRLVSPGMLYCRRADAGKRLLLAADADAMRFLPPLMMPPPH